MMYILSIFTDVFREKEAKDEQDRLEREREEENARLREEEKYVFKIGINGEKN